MAGERILITGGAGFIGSHVADELLRTGYRVRVLDALCDQVHGGERPAYLDPEVELIQGGVTDAAILDRALQGVAGVCHLAARVGVGQSMYEIARYTETNDLGTALLLEAIARNPVGRLVVASSMSVYGEGQLVGTDGCPVPASRTAEQLRLRRWEPVLPGAGPLTPVPTPESKPPAIASVYALNKLVQEQMCLVFGRSHGLPTTALRFFNVYGPRQALSNPYTGVLAIFAGRLLNGRRPQVFEDGGQRRDFVHVADASRACRLALERTDQDGAVCNVASGHAVSIAEVATNLARVVGRPHLEPEITGEYRAGDIRHCFADLTHARELLGYEARVRLTDGLAELAEWLEGQSAEDRTQAARLELASRGLQG